MLADSAQIALERVLVAVGQCLDRQSAESLLRLRADTEMQGRIEESADKCTEGKLTPEERDEYEAIRESSRPPFDQRAYQDEVRGRVTDVAVILTVALSAMERRTAVLHLARAC
jgi:hypothetical protein